jgi:predicted permease
MIFAVRLEMILELHNALTQDCYLYFWRTGVGFVNPKRCNYLLFRIGRQSHARIGTPRLTLIFFVLHRITQIARGKYWSKGGHCPRMGFRGPASAAALRPRWRSINALWLAPGVPTDTVMAAFLSDLRHSLRMLRKSPLFTSVAIASLALGLGANTAIFSLLDQALLRPLPVKNPHQLVLLTSPGVNRGSFIGDNSDRLFSRPLYIDLRDRNQVLSGLIARAPESANLVYRGQSEALTVELVTGNFFDVLGVRPQLGRLLSASDDVIKNAHPVVVLGHGYWMRRFGGNPNIVNQVVRINNSLMTVIGVAPREFFGVDVGRVPDVYVPLAMKTTVTATRDGYDDRTFHFLHVIGRLKPGVTIQQANASLQVIYSPMLNADLAVMTGNISQRFRDRFLVKALLLESAYNGVPTFRENAGTRIYISMAMVGLVLLIACANVANLLVARGLGRQKEIAIRLALGASRKNVVRQLLAESLALATLGGLAGLLVSLWTSSVLVAGMPGVSGGGLPALNASLDPRTIAFTFVLALVTGVGFGLLPAMQSTRPNVYPTLKDQGGSVIGGFGQIRSRQALVIAQVALSLLLLVGAGLFTRSLINLRKLDPGFRTANLVVFSIDASRNGYSQTRIHQLYEEIQHRLASVPGVASASLAQIVPLSGDAITSTIHVPGYEPKTDENMQPNFDEVSPGYFRTMGIPLLVGRDFRPQDKPGGHKVAVVNETFVKRFLGTGNPLGRKFGDGTEGPADVEIVGVVKDGKYNTLRDKKTSFVYVPYQQDPDLGTFSANVRTLAPPEALMPALRHEIANIDSNLAIWDLKTMQSQVNESLFAERVTAILCTCFGALATVLAFIGLYGVMAFSVARRTREIGIRMALGAGRGRVLGMVLKEVAWMCLIGVGLGVPIAIALSRYLVSQLYGVAPTDLLTLVSATLTMMCVSLIAGFLPARRAASVDPTIALRYE